MTKLSEFLPKRTYNSRPSDETILKYIDSTWTTIDDISLKSGIDRDIIKPAMARLVKNKIIETRYPHGRCGCVQNYKLRTPEAKK